MAGSNKYWVGNSGTWTDASHWSLTSGGAGGEGPPLADRWGEWGKAYFDANSFTADGATVTMDAGHALDGVPLNIYCDDLEINGVLHSPVFTLWSDFAGQGNINISNSTGSFVSNGSFIQAIGNLSITGTYDIDLDGSSVRAGGVVIKDGVTVSGVGTELHVWGYAPPPGAASLGYQPGVLTLDGGVSQNVISGGSGSKLEITLHSVSVSSQLPPFTFTVTWPKVSPILSTTFTNVSVAPYSINCEDETNIDGGGNFGLLFPYDPTSCYLEGSITIPVSFYSTLSAPPQPALNGFLEIPLRVLPVLRASTWIYASLSIPIQANGTFGFAASYGSYVDATLELPNFIAEGGGEITSSFYPLTISASAQGDTLATMRAPLPFLTLTSLGLSEEKAIVSGFLPSLRVLSDGQSSEVTSIARPLPLVRLTASAINGMLSGVMAPVPSVKIISSAYWLAGGSIEVSLPHFSLHSRAENSDVLAILMNTKNFALTEYVNYGYHSLGFFNGKMVGAKKDGIYELTGDDDNGENISWSFKTGKLDMDDNRVKKLRHVWLSYNPSGDLTLVVDDGEEEYEYDVESMKQIDNAYRVKIGKGIRNRFLQFELKNVANESIALDRMRIFSEPIMKKR